MQESVWSSLENLTLLLIEQHTLKTVGKPKDSTPVMLVFDFLMTLFATTNFCLFFS